MKYAITGATGHLGRQIVAAMKPLVKTSELYLGVHTPSKAQAYQQQGMHVAAIDYQQPEQLRAFFQDSDVLIYIPARAMTVIHEYKNLKMCWQRFSKPMSSIFW